jgi:DNA-binding MarR family transcriptional regulator
VTSPTDHEHDERPGDRPDDRYVLVTALADELLRLTRRRSSTYVDSELENSAFRLLWVLSDGRARTLRELAHDLTLEVSTVNRQVHAALDGGLLERFEVPGSAARLVRPTPAGRAAYERDARLRGEVIASVLDELGTARSQALVGDLRDLNDAWDRALHPEDRAGGASSDAAAVVGGHR